jgi:hypothetical protein
VGTGALVELHARGDRDAFDAEVERAGGARVMLEALLANADADERARARACFPRVPSLFSTERLDVGALVKLGAVGLWESSVYVLDALPRFEPRSPSPIHEQWDALVGLSVDRVETVWLPIELLASLSERQRPLGRRIVLGLERRFGARAARVAEARGRLGVFPLADLVAANGTER